MPHQNDDHAGPPIDQALSKYIVFPTKAACGSCDRLRRGRNASTAARTVALAKPPLFNARMVEFLSMLPYFTEHCQDHSIQCKQTSIVTSFDATTSWPHAAPGAHSGAQPKVLRCRDTTKA
jgi:hypothetical protein